MPRPPHRLRLGPFLGGRNSRMEAMLLRPDEAQTATNVELETGAVSGMLDLSASVSVNATYPNARWIWFTAAGYRPGTTTWDSDGVWQWSDERRWALNDGGKTYHTRLGGTLVVIDGAGTSFPLGIAPPQTVDWTLSAAGSLAATYDYGISYITFDERESNIQNFRLRFAFPIGTNDQITFNGVWPTDPRVARVQLWRATVTSGAAGNFQRLRHTVDRAVTTLADTGAGDPGDGTPDTAPSTIFPLNPLSWTYGAGPDNTGTYTADHSPPPAMTRLSDRIHTVGTGSTAAGGIIVGAVGNELRWSVDGEPMYWPTLNINLMDRPVEAIVAYPRFSAIFTPGGVYSLSGSNDASMSVGRLDAFHFIRPGWGKSAVRTPYGTVFVSYDGLAVFDGVTTRRILDGKLERDFFDSLTFYDAGYFQGRYVLAHSTGQLYVDLIDGLERARYWTSSTYTINALAFTDFRPPIQSDPHRSVRSGVATLSALDVRNFAFVSNKVDKLYYFGGSTLEFTAVTTSERSMNEAYVLNTGTTSSAWANLTAITGLRSNIQAVYLRGATPGTTNSIFMYGGYNIATTTYSATAPIFNTITDTWSSATTTNNPGPIAHYALAADTTFANDTDAWLHGGYNGTTLSNSLFVFSLSNATWTNASSTAFSAAVMNHGMAYVPAAVFADSLARLFVFGGATTNSHTTGINTVQAITTPFGSGVLTTDTTSATAVGVAARSRHVWRYNALSRRIILHGGRANDADGTPLADLWEFNPRTWVDGDQSGAWANVSGSVVGFGERYAHGGDFLGNASSATTSDAETLFLVGGSSGDSAFNSDMRKCYLGQLEAQQSTVGLYCLRNANGGNIYRMWGGAALQWIWRTGDFMGDNSAAYKTVRYLKAVDYEGDVNISYFANNAPAVSLVTLSSATRTQDERWFSYSQPGTATKATNNTGTALSSVSGAIPGSYSLIVVSDDGGPPGRTLRFADGQSRSYSGQAWADLPWPITLNGANGETVVLTQSGTPSPNSTQTDTVVVPSVSPRGRRLSLQFTGATAAVAASGVAGKLYQADVEIHEETGG